MQAILNVVQDRTGAAISGASVAVYTALNALATLYSDNGVTPIANPTLTNTDGEYQFYAANGTYRIEITATGYSGQSILGVVFFDPADSPIATTPITIANGGTSATTLEAAATNLQGTGLNSNAVGARMIIQNSQSENYVTTASDSGAHIFHPSADTTPRTFTIAANASVAYPVGTAITFINQNGAGVVTIAINSDTMRLAGAGTTGSRTLAANGVATAVKVTSTEWIISGTGLT